MKKPATDNPKLRLLIVDDEPEAINILRLLLQDMDDVEVAGSTCDPEKV